MQTRNQSRNQSRNQTSDENLVQINNLVMKLNTEAIKALNSPDVRDKLMAQGLIPAPMSPEQLGQFIREDYERWARVIKAANVKLD